MNEDTLLLCSGDRQRLLMDLNTLGYRTRLLPDRAGVAVLPGERRNGDSDKPHRGYCLTPTLAEALSSAGGIMDNLLITGETGVGKEVLARVLCEQTRLRPEFPVIHCQALHWVAGQNVCATCIRDHISDAIEQGAPLLLFDEIGDLGTDCQRAAMEQLHKANGTAPRLVATSNRSIQVLLEQQKLLPEFLTFLDPLRVDLPPLRERPGEVPLLLQWFIEEANALLGAGVEGAAPPAIRQAIGHLWPGNARELRSAVFRAVLEQPSGWIQQLPIELAIGQSNSPLGAVIRQKLLMDAADGAQTLARQFEQELLRNLHELHQGNKSRIARALGISRNTLKSRLREHDLC